MSTSSGKILIVDDDPKLRRALHTTLHSLGFEVMESPNGEQALKDAENHKFDVVLLDINMPGMGGIEACRQLRRSALRLQILMLTVRETEEDRIKALDAGADDYVTKPFSVPELTARIRAAIRRATTPLAEAADTLMIGDIELDPARRVVRKAGNIVRLTPKEFELLHYLMAHAGLPVTHATLLHTVWGAEYSQQREYLRTFIHELRKKLEDDPASPQYLLTEAYVGYRFREPESESAKS
jgi:two-component system, OmpR family, KDP operon response regulator KdpE